MPPKKGGGKKTSKSEQKKRDKVIEDKTFGLKNKKGKKQQEAIARMKQSANQNHRQQQGGKPQMSKKDRNAALMAEVAMMSALYKPLDQKVEKGVDPKSVLCEFFKKGNCQKGAKCKFSHNLTQGRKGAKRDLYSDDREKDTMDKWDQQKLEDVVKKKHTASKATTTDIICKHFLKAIDDNQYGWFWTCPNGGDKCKYRHALPPGYVLKKDRKKAKEEADQISLEELIEQERQALGPNVHKVTFETFMAWKKRKIAEKKKALAKENAKKKKSLAAGSTSGITGRDMFSFNPEIAGVDDGDDGDAIEIVREKEEDGGGDGVVIDASVFENMEISEEEFAKSEAELQRISKLQAAADASTAEPGQASSADTGTTAAAASSDGDSKKKGKAKAAAPELTEDMFAGLDDIDVNDL